MALVSDRSVTGRAIGRMFQPKTGRPRGLLLLEGSEDCRASWVDGDGMQGIQGNVFPVYL